MTIALIILLPLLIGPGAALLAGRAGLRACALAVALVTAAALALVLSESSRIFAGQSPLVSVRWLPELGLNFSLRMDGLALLFALLILGIGLLIILYARYYLT